MPDKGF